MTDFPLVIRWCAVVPAAGGARGWDDDRAISPELLDGAAVNLG